jgi:Mor family transcriptional regulator
MRYRKANEILPEKLVELIQDYIDGGYVYIPRKQENKKSWGETSKVREELQVRNLEIYSRYQAGASVKELAEQFYLSEKSIQRIVLQEKKANIEGSTSE